ncbi:MAG TPA: TRAP transporter fused permease subunit [Alphaproteobacteria bacterium]|nr:TRAP transporter fused permease subunit [Alphaproteobacteria bacterium]
MLDAFPARLFRGPLFRVDVWFAMGARRSPEGWAAWAFALGSAALTLYVIASAVLPTVSDWRVAINFLTGSLALCFLMIAPSPHADVRRVPWYDGALAVAAVALGGYFMLNAARIEGRIPFLDLMSRWDVIFGTALILLTLEMTRRVVGFAFALLTLDFIVYALLGHHLGGILTHARVPYRNFIDTEVLTDEGMLGLPLETAAKYAFLFVLFGEIMRFARSGAFFNDLATVIAGRRSGAPAKIAVISSGLYGAISGSTTLDVVTTGSISIPMMKRHGYGPNLAAAIELTASAGGAIMPPVMGSAAFIMAEYADIPYREVALAAVLPALLYYIAVYAQVHFQSVNQRLPRLREDEIPKLGPNLRKGAIFLAPTLMLILGLVAGFDAPHVAIAAGAFALLLASVRRDSRFDALMLLRTAADTVLRMMPIIAACAAAGLITTLITVTGLGPKFAEIAYVVTGDSMPWTLFIAAVFTMTLGMGMPIPAAYFLAAVLMAPVLQNLGLPEIATHMFLLCFAAMSAITPPTHAASYAAATIAGRGTNPLHISITAVRFALAAFVVPFAFAFSTTLLMIGSPWRIAIDFATAALGFILIAAACEGHPRLGTLWWERMLLGASGLFFVAPPLWGNWVGLILAALSMASVGWRNASTRPAGRPEKH